MDLDLLWCSGGKRAGRGAGLQGGAASEAPTAALASGEAGRRAELRRRRSRAEQGGGRSSGSGAREQSRAAGGATIAALASGEGDRRSSDGGAAGRGSGRSFHGGATWRRREMWRRQSGFRWAAAAGEAQGGRGWR
ncbi:hypothetical protein ACP70R_001108 [Stipagrostis hirtigluma subsp. patula]